MTETAPPIVLDPTNLPSDALFRAFPEVIDRHPKDAPCDLSRTTELLLLTMNHVEMTKACLSVIKSTHAPIHFSVLDNGSTDDTPEFLKQMKAAYPEKFSIYLSKENHGIGKGYNWLLERVPKGRDVLLLANDIIVDGPHWLCKMRACGDSDPDVAMTGPKLLHPPPGGFIQSAGTYIPMWAAGATLSPVPVGEGSPSYMYSECRNVAQTAFVGLLVKEKFLPEFRFDPEYLTPFWEDTDLALKFTIDLGLKARYCGKTAVVHIKSTTVNDPIHATRARAFVQRNAATFYGKWRHKATVETCQRINAP